jgi:hypothetical protein
MSVDAASWRVGSRLVRLGLILHASRVEGAGPQNTTKLDCGANSLFILLRLEGYPISLDRMVSVLPPRQPQGIRWPNWQGRRGRSTSN